MHNVKPRMKNSRARHSWPHHGQLISDSSSSDNFVLQDLIFWVGSNCSNTDFGWGINNISSSDGLFFKHTLSSNSPTLEG